MTWGGGQIVEAIPEDLNSGEGLYISEGGGFKVELNSEGIDYLRSQLNWDGLVVTRSRTDEELDYLYAINEGADVIVTDKQKEGIQKIQDYVNSGIIKESRIDESVERILCWEIENIGNVEELIEDNVEDSLNSEIITLPGEIIIDPTDPIDPWGIGEEESEKNDLVKVQYYARVRSFATEGDSNKQLTIIDTRGGILPKNKDGTNVNSTNIFLNADGTIKYEESYQEMYAEKEVSASEITLAKNLIIGGYGKNYGDFKVLVGYVEFGAPAGAEPEEWDVYEYSDSLSFTKYKEGDEDYDGSIHIGQGYFIRFVGEPKEVERDFDVTFFDYDVTDGVAYKTQINAQQQYLGTGLYAGDVFTGDYLSERFIYEWSKSSAYTNIWIRTQNVGINSSGNLDYGGGSKFVFGNRMMNTGYNRVTWSDPDGVSNTFNRANKGKFKECTYGMVTGMNARGGLVFNSGINAPPLFDSGKRLTGRTEYSDEYKLEMDCWGNSLTLKSVEGTGIVNLDSFGHPGRYQHIWTNNFWPMDYAPSFGTGKHDIKMGDSVVSHGGRYPIKTAVVYEISTALEPNDDGKLHNSYFGMKFSVNFKVEDNYIGPMDYTFFGDDDMWVFLTDDDDNSQLICDIGGIHTSVGEYVDLWDYIPKDETKWYTLDLFYTERGACGSTCWMNFNLPNASPRIELEEQLGSLLLEKQVEGVVGNTDEEFEFKIDLLDDELKGREYTYTGSKEGVYKSGDIITLKQDEYIEIGGIPAGVEYKITELNNINWDVIYPDNAQGIIKQDKTEVVIIVNEKVKGLVLPQTGGLGIKSTYAVIGVFVVGVVLYKLFRRRLYN